MLNVDIAKCSCFRCLKNTRDWGEWQLCDRSCQ